MLRGLPSGAMGAREIDNVVSSWGRSTGSYVLPHSNYRRFGKRAFDVVFATLMLLSFLPLFGLIVVALRYRGVSPFFYRHERIGRDGERFGCWKFTTMYPEDEGKLNELLESDPVAKAEWSSYRKLRNDPRVIPGIGRVLRITSLDELPQLFNVIKGEMSIVGPRPVTEAELDRYGSDLQYYLAVKPGLTGPWQIGGRSNSTFEQRVQKDVWYVRNASFATDLKLVAKTIVSFMSGRLTGAC